MRSAIRMAVSCLLLGASVPALADTLTVDQVVAMSAAGLGDEAIIAKIKTSGARFDLSPDEMVALKAKGVTGPVLAAMINGNTSSNDTPALSVNSPDPRVPHAPGVYVLTADGMAMSRLDPTVSSQAKTGGIWGYALTGGLASMSVKAAIANETARTHIKKGQPAFYFFFDESNPGTPAASSWLSGTAANVTSPNEFTLIELTKKNGRREARVGSHNIGGTKTGVMDKDRLAFNYDLVRPGVYRVTPSKALAAGEYAFIYSLSGGGSAGALSARLYDFAVD